MITGYILFGISCALFIAQVAIESVVNVFDMSDAYDYLNDYITDSEYL